jgi:hypothetical protein
MAHELNLKTFIKNKQDILIVFLQYNVDILFFLG